ncbi:o-succinylbenzoate--CoA ligase [Macrococcus animalis]|uniref:o-succinylbenzoate--CoA ligase n=1 Tax=Macrococcus animalis TaxID=3395467 RepID=UPI0039BE6D02
MEWLKSAAHLYPDKPAIIFNEQRITYEKLYENAQKVAYELKQFNHKRIALQAENTLSDCYIIHAAIIANIEIVMVNKHLTENEISKQMASVDTSLILTNDNFTSIQSFNKSKLVHTALDSHHSYLGEHNQPNDILSIMFTSGTTGVQKAVPQRFNNHVASARNCKNIFTYSHDSIWLNVLPLFHISGLSILLRAVIDGCTIVLHEKFNALQIIYDIQEKNITHISLVPQTLERLLKNGLHSRYSLEGILIGGAKLDDRLLAQARRINLPIYTSFGMTETCSQMITASPMDIEKYPGSVGRVKDTIQLFNVDNNVGEIGVQGENVMHGYLYPKTANNDAFIGNYFLTGDIGYIEDNYLYILDRRKDLIISGGENIYPSEIEQVILTHTSVHATCVIGIDEEKWGSVPICLYEADRDLEDDIKRTLDDNIAKFKHPKQFVRVEALKRTSNGKISRHQCKEWYEHDYHKA